MSCCTAVSPGGPGSRGFWIAVLSLAFGLAISASVIGAVAGRIRLVLALRIGKRLGWVYRLRVG